jgi:methionyl aminopeptidase
MITIKNKLAIQKMVVAGQKLATIVEALAAQIKPGVTAYDVDHWVANQLKEEGLVSAMKGYRGYQHVTCISLNDEVVHGVPRATTVFKDGDLVKVDVCASWKGYCADMARCFFVGTARPEAQKLVAVAMAALDKGIAQACVGNRISDISHAIQQEVERHGFGVVRDFAGHGIGKHMHEDPEILNYGKPHQGAVIRSGMAFALEPMITVGHYKVHVENDGWTVRTADKSLAAHVEDTVVITDNGPHIITRHQEA